MRDAENEAGYATAAAAMISLALALVASAVVAEASSTYRLAKSDLNRSQLETKLDGAFTQAAVQLLRSRGDGPFSLSASDLQVAVRAEPEWRKLKLGAATALDDQALNLLKVTDGDGLRQRLSALENASAENASRIEALDGSPVWRRCAASYVSVFGTESRLLSIAATTPQQGASGGRAGEVWRLIATAKTGAAEERYVRFQGDLRRPIAILQRRRIAARIEGGSCPDLAAPKA